MNESTALLEAATKFISALTQLIWPALIIGILAFLKDDIIQLIRLFKSRILHGGGVKIGGFEIESIRIRKISEHDIKSGAGVVISETRIEDFENPRRQVYDSCREVMVVHALQRSNSDKQLYDILIYVVPHKTAFINNVVSVTYYFGKHFGLRTFTSTDKAKNFAVSTSAYGQMLCMARITFADGHVAEQYRYIDFEMGDGTREAPQILIEDRQKKAKPN